MQTAPPERYSLSSQSWILTILNGHPVMSAIGNQDMSGGKHVCICDKRSCATRGLAVQGTTWDARIVFSHVVRQKKTGNVPEPMEPGQFLCCRCTRNCGCQLPLETFSTRTSTRSSKPRFPSLIAHTPSRSGAPSALDLFPFYIIRVSPRSKRVR